MPGGIDQLRDRTPQLDDQEVAEMLDITESTSRSNLVKARMKLQVKLTARMKSNEE